MTIGRCGVVGTALALAACSHSAYIGDPRFGSLQTDKRPFSFAHNIELFETTNGMKVALIRDTRTNLATVDLRFTVGAAEDPAGRTGLAHLVEHVLFELRPGPGQPTLGDRLGQLALSYNATTDWDATNFTSTSPIEQLDAVIALEGERLRATCDQLDEPTFARERDVVLAETAERGNFDFLYRILGQVYPGPHPYARALGTNEVAQATRAEACAFIDRYYAPDRAYLVITGAFDVDHVRALVGKTFGPIQHHATGTRTPIEAPILDGTVTAQTAPIERPTALVFLPHPAWGAPGTVKYRIAEKRLATALSSSDDDHGWITSTAVWQAGGARAPVLVAAVQVKKAEHLQAAADEVFARVRHLWDDLDASDARRIGGRMTLSYLAAWDDLDERGGWIADFLQYTDHNWFMLLELRMIDNLDWPAAARSVSATWVPDQSKVILLTPEAGHHDAEVAAVPTGTHDVDPWRAPVDAAEADRRLPAPPRTGLGDRVERYQLGNGLTVELALDNRSPLVETRLVYPVGRAHQPADQPMIATAAAALLDWEYDDRMSRKAASKLVWALGRGTVYDWDVSETATTFTARGLAQYGDWHVWFLSWLLEQGRYQRKTVDELRAAGRKSTGDDDDTDPDELAFLTRLYGAGHPYATPTPSMATLLGTLDAGALDRWRREHFVPRGATLIVSGAFDVAQVKREIRQLYGAWPDTPPGPLPAIATPHPADGPSWLAEDDADASQVRVKIGFATGSDPIRDRAARKVLAHMLNDRVRDVRERLGASYGVYASYDTGAAGGALLVRGDVDEGKAGPAVTAIVGALADTRDHAADQRDGFVRARRAALAEAMAQVGGAASIAAQLDYRASMGLPLDAFDGTAAAIAALTPADVARVAAADLQAVHMVVQLRGQPAAVDAAFAALGQTPERVEQPAADDDDDDAPGDDDDTDAPSVDPDDLPGSTVGALAEPPLPPGTLADRLSIDDDGDLYQGDHRLSLSGFLTVSGHGDRASAISKRRWLRGGLAVGGLAAFLGGGAITLLRDRCDIGLPMAEYDDCESSRDLQGYFAVGLMVAGTAGLVTAKVLDNLEPPRRELQRYADSYNRRRGIRSPDSDRVYDVSLAPVIAPHGGGLVLSARW